MFSRKYYIGCATTNEFYFGHFILTGWSFMKW